jgi:hypothetical protein
MNYSWIRIRDEMMKLSSVEKCVLLSVNGNVQSVIRNFQSLCVLCGRIHSRTRGWSLLKVREGNSKRGHGGTRRKLEAERDFVFSRCL